MKIVTRERRNWMRLRSHTVVFDRDPGFGQFAQDPSGDVMRIVHLWLADRGSDPGRARAYLGSIRHCGTWRSQRELLRFYRRATHSAAVAGETGQPFRRRLSRFLRSYFKPAKPITQSKPWNQGIL